jgi:hypothetical protein
MEKIILTHRSKKRELPYYISRKMAKAYLDAMYSFLSGGVTLLLPLSSKLHTDLSSTYVRKLKI